MTNIEVYKVEGSVPIPVRRSYQRVQLNDLEVGQSILFPADQRSTVQSNASRLKKRNGKVFTVSAVDEQHCRVWRVS